MAVQVTLEQIRNFRLWAHHLDRFYGRDCEQSRAGCAVIHVREGMRLERLSVMAGCMGNEAPCT